MCVVTFCQMNENEVVLFQSVKINLKALCLCFMDPYAQSFWLATFDEAMYDILLFTGSMSVCMYYYCYYYYYYYDYDYYFLFSCE